jgi:hypothetical protein
MSSPTRRALHQERRAALQTAHTSPANALLAWLQNPAVVFVLPLIILLCGPALYDFLSPSGTLPVIESRLQEVASLMDDIYTTLANMSFIPATAIRRGPHQINTTAIPCKRDPSVLRLMEIMPYVDRLEVQEEDEVQRTDWLFGGEFIDYRNPDPWESCDPIKADNTWWTIKPTTVALTSWGTGGWNYDRTHVLLYDTMYNAIQVYEGEEWVSSQEEARPPDDYVESIHSLFRRGTKSPSAVKVEDEWGDNDWVTWFDAPWLLRRILEAYQSLAWTPWETSNREDGWGVNGTVIRELLRKNGWPEKFDPDQFNADFIRAQHAPSGKGAAEAVYKKIEELDGNRAHDLPGYRSGAIDMARHNIGSFEMQARNADDEQERWYPVFRAQSQQWLKQRHEADLEAAKKEAERLCPGGLCVKEEDMILWELYSLEKEYQKKQRASPPESTCEWDLEGIIEWAPPSPRYENCVAKRKREAHWLHLAYTQSKAEAVAHCAKTGCDLNPLPTLEEQARARIKELEAEIKRGQDQAKIMYEWLPTLPEHAEKARRFFEMEASAAANGPFYLRDRIEWFEQVLAEGDEKARLRLQRCLDDEGCA